MLVKRLQLTLAILKPDVVCNPIITKEIQQLMLHNDFLFVRTNQIHLSRERAKQFYAEHDGRFFFNRLVSYMSSGPIITHILARHEAIPVWRRLMGPTKVFKTVYDEPNSILGRFGLTDTRNCTHGSDSEESAKREIGVFFPDFDVDGWYKEQEELFREGKVRFDSELMEHRLEKEKTEE